MLQSIPSFYSIYSKKSLFISTTTYEKFLVCNEYCVAMHSDSTCALPNCKYHVLLVADKLVNTLLEKLDTLCFTYQFVDCFYTLFKYRFSGNIIAKNGIVFDCVQRAVSFNQSNKALDRMPSIAKKRLLRKKFKSHLWSSSQKSISTQTNGSVFTERVQQVKRTKFELDLIKIVDCFLDGYGSYDGHFVSFKIKSLN